MDNGNLIMKNANDSRIWESFDHPGNTWLPSMLLGPGKRLQSWLSPDNPSPGPYALMMGNVSNFICVYNDSVVYYDSGTWNGNKFSNVPEMQNHYIYGFSFNSSGFDWEASANEAFKISRFVIEYSGIIREMSYLVSSQSWNPFWLKPSNPCGVERMCGPNSICHSTEQPNCKCMSTAFEPVSNEEWDQNTFRQGCKRKSPLNCGTNDATNSTHDGFISMNQTSFAWSFDKTLAMADLQKCKDMCLKDCECNGFFFDADGYGNCSSFSQDLSDGAIFSSAVGTFYMRVSARDLASGTETSTGKSRSHALLIALLVGGIAALAMASLAVYLPCTRRRPAPEGHSQPGLKAFSFAELQTATKNFRDKLGSGGFGTVYRGFAGDQEFAVKRLDRLDDGEKQFKAEVRTLGTIQHVNLVKLLGFCYEGKHRLLVYEMAHNGSLASHLFSDNTRAAALTWRIRHKIALESARGIAYLHESCHKRIIHCDIKPENILLGTSFNVKVADFGLAKLVGHEFSRVLTTLRGTRGYLAPEWIAGLPITTKTDVYSFGMTLLELISGQRNVHMDCYIPSSNPSSVFFPIRVALRINQNCEDLACFVDGRMQKGDVSMEELKRMLYCAIWCIQDNEELRPSMGEAIKILEGSLLKGPPPIPKLLQCLIEL
ncbi:hypothetical protein GOP47_0009549 [Adiantum capillus-veneris]|uniref:non-specific serine/threonine protein kinase n=1 Tax=Adiantum capillus-veneris TaxID=13818 RepID=A0A9D4ZH98_ADICA|nr:hypothetical protein GOP47_0009549 [Adiantum capillus-veneris]